MLHWKDLVHLSNDELATYDVAMVNLACAADLPDAPSPQQIRECLQRLDKMAEATRYYTDKQMPVFHRQPDIYHHSEAKFRIVCMISIIQRLFGVLYNTAKIPADAPFYTADTFIHGALLGDGGTCASLPVVYVAVGRRLGYPLKLVSTYRHQFCRWEKPHGERFNIEANNHSIDAPSDDHFREGLFACPPHIYKAARFLETHTPREEMAAFMVGRSNRWLDNFNRPKEALESFIWASVLDPKNVFYQAHVKRLLNVWADKLDAMKPVWFPKVRVTFPERRRYPDPIPVILERTSIFYEQFEKILTNPVCEKEWLGALRRGERTSRTPVAIHIHVHV